MNVTATSAATAPSPLDALNTKLDAQGKQTLNEDDFFKLLTTQLSAQDPLKPMDDTSFISQMASFSSLQQMQSVAKDMAELKSQQQVSAANGYLGKTVTATDDKGTPQTGAVSAVAIDSGTVSLVINGANCSLDSVSNVSNQ